RSSRPASRQPPFKRGVRVLLRELKPVGSAARSERALHLPLRVALRDVAPLVVQLLAAAERQLDLHAAVLEVEPRGNERQAALRDLAAERRELAGVEEELAV